MLLGLILAASLARADNARELVTTVCLFCHGEAGNSLGPDFPKLAGQQPKYLQKQLSDFLSGNRPNEAMTTFLPFIKVEDIPGLAAYYAEQKPTPWPVSDAALAEMGKRVYEDGNTDTGLPACVGCHHTGAAGRDEFPRLAAQSSAYLLKQLAHFKSGIRSNDKGSLMRVVASRMSENEMKAVAEYLSGLP
jgi:cytochrome c553